VLPLARGSSEKVDDLVKPDISKDSPLVPLGHRINQERWARGLERLAYESLFHMSAFLYPPEG